MNSLLRPPLVILLCMIIVCSFSNQALAVGVFQNFDDLPVTRENDIPGDGGGWSYSSAKTNPRGGFFGGCGWWNENTYSAPNNSVHDFFHLYINRYNTGHMGYTSFSFFEIDDSFSISGNSLKIVTTGGMKNGGNTTIGLPLFSKEEYLAYVNNNQNPVGSEPSGSPYIYFKNSSPKGIDKVPFEVAAGANRLSLYIYLPDTVDNYISRPNDLTVSSTLNLGPYNGIGGHWYNRFYTRGGGWTHIQMDSHPNHNNACCDNWQWPYPSNSCRDYGVDYFNKMTALYLAVAPYGSFAMPKYTMWIDEMVYLYDAEPQNGETINNLSVLYKPSSTSFEIGFHSKYKSAGLDKATYEIRYSFSPITNATWNETTPVRILSDSRFNIEPNSNGIVRKPNSWRDPVWAPFKISSTDENKLTPGTRIYFAVKDVSQDPNNLELPNPVYNNGRDYVQNKDSLDFAGDAPALPLIKRIDYYIAGGSTPINHSKPIIKSYRVH